MFEPDLELNFSWVWEFERWKELVFALLTQVSSYPEDRVRQIVEYMANLDLLDIPTLASICTAGKQPDLDDTVARAILFRREACLKATRRGHVYRTAR